MKREIRYEILSESIKSLIDKREQYRNNKQYNKADSVRKALEKQGIVVEDTSSETKIYSLVEKTEPLKTTLSILGSGEAQSSGRKIHDYVLSLLGLETVNICLISTPAGFEPNVETVYGEYKDFFEKRLKNYKPNVKVIYANTRDLANNPKIVEPIKTADYIVTGPGSPTYTVDHLKNTLLIKEIVKRIKTKKASLSLSSAAAIAFSKHVLPVYEIYKVGEPLHWKKGLNIYQKLFKELSVIPHFNNTEGGEKLDTRFCYMGKKRFDQLRNMLPKNQLIWGIDEHTGVIIDVSTKNIIDTIGIGSLYQIQST